MSTNPEARAWIRVRADALRRNLAKIRRSVGPDAAVIPMVKADAYGLGVLETVRTLRPDGPWGWGVATVEEGRELREHGVEEPVAVFTPLAPESIEPALAAGLQVSVSSLDSLDALVSEGRRTGRLPEIHVEVDTGIGRAGFDWSSASDWAPVVTEAAESHVRWVGCYTHLHSADEDDASVHEQHARFEEALGRFGSAPDGLLIHVLNSAGAFAAPLLARGAVRPGLFLFGGSPRAAGPRPEPVVSLHARVVHVKEAPAGSTVGYGATHTATGPERWATLAVGYGDGLPRALGNRGTALIRGRRVPLIGRISMDTAVVDISEVPEVGIGDVATLLGEDGDQAITVEDVAELAGTVSYEVLTGLTRRLPRVWTGLETP